MTCFVAGIGTAVPPHNISQVDAAELTKSFCCETADQERLLRVLYRRTGVKSRYSVLLESSNGGVDRRQSFYLPARNQSDRGPETSKRMFRYEDEAAPLGIVASRRALEQARMQSDQVTHLITVSCSGFNAPGFDVALIKSLKLPTSVARTHVGFMGCHGALNGLRIAKAFVEADPTAHVLLCAVELCSLHQQYGWDPDQIVANSLFADGAAAMVCTGKPNHDDSTWRVASNGAAIVPNSEDVMSWRIGDHGFQMTLSPRVPELIRRELRPWMETWLAKNQLTIPEIAAWAVHPGGPKILTAFSEATGLDRPMLEDSHQTMAKYGNMSSPTVLFILERIRRAQPGTPCVALGFGPGLAIEAALLL